MTYCKVYLTFQMSRQITKVVAGRGKAKRVSESSDSDEEDLVWLPKTEVGSEDSEVTTLLC